MINANRSLPNLMHWYTSNSYLFDLCQAKKGGVLGLPGMRSVFWDHMREAKKRLADLNPGFSKSTIAKMARDEYWP